MAFKWGLVGVDESGTDKYPIIYVAAASNIHSDGELRGVGAGNRIGKKRPKKSLIDIPPNCTKHVEYSWLQFTEEHKDQIQRHYRWGVIIGSLLKGEKIQKPFDIYIDGRNFNTQMKDYSLGCIRDITGLEKDEIRLQYDLDLDRRVGVVNHADAIAYWVNVRNWSIEKNGKDKHKKPILTELIK